MIPFVAYYIRPEDLFNPKYPTYRDMVLSNNSIAIIEDESKQLPMNRVAIPSIAYEYEIFCSRDDALYNRSAYLAYQKIAKSIAEKAEILMGIVKQDPDSATTSHSYVVGREGENIIRVSALRWQDDSPRQVVCFITGHETIEKITKTTIRVHCCLANLRGGFLADPPATWFELQNQNGYGLDPDKASLVTLIKEVEKMISSGVSDE